MSADAPQLLYTSAPEGLERGAVGFCVVAATPGLPRGAAATAEGLSGYRHAGPPGDPGNPVVLMHVRLPRNAGHGRHVLARVSDAGRDYTGRQNKLARLAFIGDPPPRCGPAAALAAPPFSPGEKWSGTVGELPHWSPPADRPAGVCRTWAQAGEVGWAGVLAAGVLNGDRAPVALILPAGGGEETSRQALALFAEAIALLPPGRRWDATFTTHDGPRPAGAECRWRAAPAGSAEAKALRRLRGATVLDLTNPAALAAALPTAAALKPAIAAARAGRPLTGSDAPIAAATAPAESILSEGAAPPPAFPDDPATPVGGVTFEESAARAAPADRGSTPPAAPPRSRAHTPPPLPGRRSRKGLWIGAASAAVLLLVAGVGVWVTLSQPELLTKWTGTPEAAADGASPATGDDDAAPGASEKRKTTVAQAATNDAAPKGDTASNRERPTPQDDETEIAAAPAAETNDSTATAMTDAAESRTEVAEKNEASAADTEIVPTEAPTKLESPTLVRAPIEGPIEGNTLRTVPLDPSVLQEALDGPLSDARLWLPAALIKTPGENEGFEEFGRGVEPGKGGSLAQGLERGLEEVSVMQVSLDENRLVLSSTLPIQGLAKDEAVRRASAAILTPAEAVDVKKGITFGDLPSAVASREVLSLSKGRLSVPLSKAAGLIFRNDVNLQVAVRVKGEERTQTVPAEFRTLGKGSDGALEATVFDGTKIQEGATTVADIAKKARKALNDFEGDRAGHRLQQSQDEVPAGSGNFTPFIPPSYQGDELDKYAERFEAEMEKVTSSLDDLAQALGAEEPPAELPAELRWEEIKERVMPWNSRHGNPPEGKPFDAKLGFEPPGLKDNLKSVRDAYESAVRLTSGTVTGATFFYRVQAIPTEQEAKTMKNRAEDRAKLPPDANVILLQIGENPPSVPAVAGTDASR